MDKSQKINKITQTCCTVGANGKTECTLPMEELTILTEVGLGSQVDLILTNIGQYLLLLGLTIQVKVYGGQKLEERAA